MRIIHISTENKTHFDQQLNRALENAQPDQIVSIQYKINSNQQMATIRYSVLIILKNTYEPAATTEARNNNRLNEA